MFSNLFKSIEIQNLKGFDIFDQGRECDLNKKSGKSDHFGLNNRLPHMCKNSLIINRAHIKGERKAFVEIPKDRPFTLYARSYKDG